MVNISEGLAARLKPLGIGVSVLCPGFVRTRINESGRNRPERYGPARIPDPASPASCAPGSPNLHDQGSTRRRSPRKSSRPSETTNSTFLRIPAHVGARNWSNGLALSWRRWTRRQPTGGHDGRSGSVRERSLRCRDPSLLLVDAATAAGPDLAPAAASADIFGDRLPTVGLMLTGGCFCGAIRYEADGAPFRETNCHCSICRRTTGAPFLSIFSVKSIEFRIIKGQPARFNSTAKTVRSFCSRCGTRLTSEHPDFPEEIGITASIIRISFRHASIFTQAVGSNGLFRMDCLSTGEVLGRDEPERWSYRLGTLAYTRSCP